MRDLVEINSNLRAAGRSVSQMERAVRQATLSSLNRATQRAKTEAGRKARERYIVKQKDVVQTISVRKALGQSLSASITSRGRAIPLINFSVNPKRRLRVPPRSIKAAVLRGGSKKNVPHAFIAKMGNHTGVFEREGRRRLPVKELRGPSVPSMVNSEEVREHVRTVFGQTMETRLPHELERTLGRLRM